MVSPPCDEWRARHTAGPLPGTIDRWLCDAEAPPDMGRGFRSSGSSLCRTECCLFLTAQEVLEAPAE